MTESTDNVVSLVERQLKSKDKRIGELETQVDILQGVVKMTDSQIKAFFDGVVTIAEKLK